MIENEIRIDLFTVTIGELLKIVLNSFSDRRRELVSELFICDLLSIFKTLDILLLLEINLIDTFVLFDDIQDLLINI